MTATKLPQHLRALGEANALKHKRAAQRAALSGCTAVEFTRVILDPPAELATYRLRQLFRGRPALIPGFGDGRLSRALVRTRDTDGYSRPLHADMRLRELTKAERQRFVRAVLAVAPKPWRAAA